jgi:tetratricopeptide (TPR) repeat protein
MSKQNHERLLLLSVLLLLSSATPAQPLPQLSDRETAREAGQEADGLRLLRLFNQQQYAAVLELGRALVGRNVEDAQVYTLLVQAAKRSGQLAALELFLKAQVQTPPPNPRAWYALGLLSHEQADEAAALSKQRECLRLLPEWAPPLEALRALDQSQTSQFGEVVNELLARNPHSPNAHLGRGLYLLKLQQPEAAVTAFEQALALQPNFAAACYQKAQTLNQRNLVAASLEALRACQSLVEASLTRKQRRDFLALEINNLARTEQTAAALAKLEDAWALAQAEGDEAYRSIYLAYQATLYQQQGDYGRALRVHQEALAASQARTDQAGQITTGRTLTQIGRDYFFLGDWEQAEAFYRQALPVAERWKERSQQALIATYLGDLWIVRDNLTEAAAAYEQAASLLKGVADLNALALSYTALAAVHLRRNELPQAGAAIQQALQAGRQSGVSATELRALADLGEWHLRSGKAAEARQTYQELQEKGRIRANWQAEWQAAAGLARAAEALGELEAAQTQYETALQVLEGMRARFSSKAERAGFMQSKQEVYQRLIGVLHQRAKRQQNAAFSAAAFHVAERARARSLLDTLSEAALLDRLLPPELLEEQRALQMRFSQLDAALVQAQTVSPRDEVRVQSLQTSLRQATAALLEWQERLRQRHPNFAALRYAQPLHVQQLQELLRQK